MQEKRRRYTPEFKSEAARLVIESSRPIAEVAREIAVHEGTLGSWVRAPALLTCGPVTCDVSG
jgi:transposase-like protein